MRAIGAICIFCSVQDLTKEKEELTKERDSHLEQIVHVCVGTTV